MGASPDVARADAPGLTAALWCSILAGPTAWAVDLTISYAIVQWTCGGGPPVVLHLITLFALAVIAGGAFAGWRSLQAADSSGAELPQVRQRARFMALFGMTMCALFAMIVVAAAIPRWVLDACQQ